MHGAMIQADMLVLGAGPAGRTAAKAAAARGVDVVLLDEGDPGTLAGVRVRAGRIVWSVIPGFQVDALGPAGPERYAAPRLVVAGGVAERVVPFPGWTLPGVCGLDRRCKADTSGMDPQGSGSEQWHWVDHPIPPSSTDLIRGSLASGNAGLKAHPSESPLDDVVESESPHPESNATLSARPAASRTVVAGCGPSLVAAALRLAASGAQVSVVDLSSRGEWLRAAPTLLARLARRCIPVLFRHAVLRAEGDGAVQRVLVAPVDAEGTPRGTGRWIAADALCVGHGIVPGSEVARLLRAPHRFDAAWDRWVPLADARGATAVPGLSVVQDAPERGAVLARPRPGLLVAMPADTVVCRCEDVTRGTIDDAFAAGAREVNQLKHFTRCGMGVCQGRLCAETAAGLLGLRAGGRAAVGQWTMRPPLRPVPLAALLGSFEYGDIPVPAPAPL